MHFDMKAPCDNCPFRRDGYIPLHAGRVAEIGGMMLDHSGGTFPCHKTTRSVDDGQGGDSLQAVDSSRHCAGALIFAEKNGNATQMMRISERLGLYDARALMANEVAKEMVFDDLDEMAEAHARHPANKGARKAKAARRRQPVEFEPEDEDNMEESTG